MTSGHMLVLVSHGCFIEINIFFSRLCLLIVYYRPTIEQNIVYYIVISVRNCTRKCLQE